MSQDLARKTFVVLTDKCLDLETDSHCESATIGRAIDEYAKPSDGTDLSFTCTNKAQWNLGRRILNNVKPPFESQEEWNEAESRRFQVSKMKGELAPDTSPASRIYIHCGSCACAVQTALKMTRNNGASEYFDFSIRIDERLSTSCRRSSTAIDVLTAIRDTIEGHVVNTWDCRSKSIGFIDCPDLEKRIYNLEQEKFGYIEPASVLQNILVEDYQKTENAIPIGAIIFIAESDFCQSSLESHPFRSEARKPRETDIFAFTPTMVGSKGVWLRKYMGSYSRSKSALEKRADRSSLLTGVIPPLSSDLVFTTPSIPRKKRSRSASTLESNS